MAEPFSIIDGWSFGASRARLLRAIQTLIVATISSRILKVNLPVTNCGTRFALPKYDIKTFSKVPRSFDAPRELWCVVAIVSLVDNLVVDIAIAIEYSCSYSFLSSFETFVIMVSVLLVRWNGECSKRRESNVVVAYCFDSCHDASRLRDLLLPCLVRLVSFSRNPSFSSHSL